MLKLFVLKVFGPTNARIYVTDGIKQKNSFNNPQLPIYFDLHDKLENIINHWMFCPTKMASRNENIKLGQNMFITIQIYSQIKTNLDH